MNTSAIITSAGALVLGGAIGTGVTYLVLKKKFQERLDRELEATHRHYRLVRKEDGSVGILGKALEEGPDRTAEETYQAAKDIIRNYEMVHELQYGSTEEEDSVSILAGPTSQKSPAERLEERQNYAQDIENVVDNEEPEEAPFVNPLGASGDIFDGDFVYEYEEGDPHLVTKLEFETAGNHWDKDSLTYFEQDDTLYEDATTGVIDDIDYVLGVRHLSMFGKRSGDANTMYIENPGIGTVYEVTRHPGSYAVSILKLSPEEVGLEDEKERPLKMRPHAS